MRIAQTPITAVMLLEFAANSWYVINDMRNASIGFFDSLRPDDYVAVMTYDLQTHILSDFTNNKQVIAAEPELARPCPASPIRTCSTLSTRRSTASAASRAASTSS